MRQQVTQPGMQRAQEQAAAMRARGAPEAAIARALGGHAHALGLYRNGRLIASDHSVLTQLATFSSAV